MPVIGKLCVWAKASQRVLRQRSLTAFSQTGRTRTGLRRTAWTSGGPWLACGVAGYRHRVTVDHEAPQPVYQQIAAILRAQIEAGELVPDRPIPGESTLMQRYGVARETARKAVRVLVAEGLVFVVQGRGAYVARNG